MAAAYHREVWTERRKRVLITRSRGQASALAARLEELGVEAIAIPTIALAPPESFAELDAGLARLGEFDWVLFTSANAVAAFGERALGLGLMRKGTVGKGWDGDGPGIKVAAIGAATARAVEAIGWRADLVPAEAVAESLAESLIPEVKAGRRRMLLVRAESARDVLPERLRAAGAEVVVAPAYRNVVPEESIPLLQGIFAEPGSWPDAITFTSSSTAVNLLRLMEQAGVTLPGTVVLASIGPITSGTLRELGYPPHVEAAAATIESLVEVLAEQLGLSGR